jgi:hypothetical protein
MRCPCVVPMLCLLLWTFASPALAGSERAADLRRQAGLVPHAPSKAFLDGYFIADEMRPAFLFGPVADFVAGRTCPTAWLIENDEKERLDRRSADNPVFEYTLTLEEDCPQGVTWYVFVDQSAMTPKQWIEWRRQFHKSKAEPEYADTVTRLEKAIEGGFPVSGELRFVSRDGVLDPRSPQESLPTAMACPPRYDCTTGAPVGQ